MSKDGFLLIVDGDKYEWDKPTITGAELRVLAGIRQNAETYLKVPGKPDVPVADATSTNLANRQSPERFSTQSPGSQAGRFNYHCFWRPTTSGCGTQDWLTQKMTRTAFSSSVNAG